MEKVIVTGATGYIASNLVRKLISLGKEVHIIIRKSSKLDLLNGLTGQLHIFEYNNSLPQLINFFQDVNADIVFHLASLFISEHNVAHVDSLIESNIIFPTHVLEAMYRSGTKKIINTGTYNQNYVNSAYNPVNLYAATKEAFEKLLEFYVEAEDFRTVTLRLYDTFGPKDPRNKIVTLFKKYAGTTMELDMSKGEQKLYPVYVDDVVDAFIAAASLLSNEQFTGHKKYFICSNEAVTLRRFAELFEKTSGKNLNINWGKRGYKKREVFEPYTPNESLPGWSPRFSVEEGLRMMLCSSSTDLN